MKQYLRHSLLGLSLAALLTGCSSDKETMSMFLAKDMCSCRFLIGQSESHCREAIQMGLLVGKVSVNEAKKEVVGQAEGASAATFRFVSEKFGCELKR